MSARGRGREEAHAAGASRRRFLGAWIAGLAATVTTGGGRANTARAALGRNGPPVVEALSEPDPGKFAAAINELTDQWSIQVGNPDAKLLQLYHQFRVVNAEWESWEARLNEIPRQSDQWLALLQTEELISSRYSELLLEIEATPAQTLAGIQAKAATLDINLAGGTRELVDRS